MFVTADETLRIFMLKPSTPLFAGIPYTRLARPHDLSSMCSQRPGALVSLLPRATEEGSARLEHRRCDWEESPTAPGPLQHGRLGPERLQGTYWPAAA